MSSGQPNKERNVMTRTQLLQALEARRLAIQAAWLAAKPAPASSEYAAWLQAYSDAAGRYFRAFIWLR
jgi:hypothetical protein